MRPNYREAKRRRRMRQLLLAALAIGCGRRLPRAVRWRGLPAAAGVALGAAFDVQRGERCCECPSARRGMPRG